MQPPRRTPAGPVHFEPGSRPPLTRPLLPVAVRLPGAGRRESRRRGGALVMVLLIVCILSVVASSMLLTTTARYETAFQSASWQESIVGAEAGVDLAMTELRKRVLGGPATAFQSPPASATSSKSSSVVYWTTSNPAGATYPNYGHAFPANNKPLVLATHDGAGVEGNTLLQARVFVDVPGSSTSPVSNFAVTGANDNNAFISQSDNPALRDQDGVDRARWWYRIRSLGVANVSGPARPNLAQLDNRLRRFSFFSDWRTGDLVSTPQVARLVEVLVAPQMNFRNALMADQQIDLGKNDVLIDSYDSSKGAYNSLTNHGTMGNIATNGKLINANNATVNGNAMTNNGTVNDGDHVTGQQSGNFYQELTPFTAGLLNPAWTSVKNDGTITGSATYTASADRNNPTLVQLNGINLGSGATLSIAAPASTSSASIAATPSFVKIYVQGNIATAGTGQIKLDPNVNAIVYVTGNVALQGNGIINGTQLARNLVVNGIQPTANSDGTYPARTINIATTQDFAGIIYAPNHDLNLALQATLGGTNSTVGSSPPVVTYTGTNGQIPSLVSQITQISTKIYNLQLDYQAQLAKYQQNGDSGAYRKMLDDQQQISQQQSIINQDTLIITGLGGTVTITTGNPVSDASAADHALGYNGVYGGYVAKTITVAEKTHVHYDETLRNAGPVNHYQIVNWFEDNVSHGAVGSAGSFWWAGAAN